MGKRTFSTDVYVEVTVNGTSLELVASVDYTMTKVVPAVTSGPPEHCHPAEGGEVEILRVAHLYHRRPVDDRDPRYAKGVRWDRVTAECPVWLAQHIFESVDKDALAEEADWSTPDD